MRYYLLIVLLLSLVICVDAQIQRSILELELNVTTKEQAINYFSKKDMEIFVTDDTKFMIENVKFGGVLWPNAILGFYRDKLNTIFFSHSDEYVPKEKLDIIWKNLCNSYLKKYHDFIVKRGTNDEEIVFEDSKTRLIAVYLLSGNIQFISIMYTDLEINNEENEINNGDL